ncbi:MAG: B12-binding domain-containing radical SAM protein, partial [Myxococcales bacterium]|nr:B12-binding domain-containing radical SAM protein [Myxococcales bacterium]
MNLLLVNPRKRPHPDERDVFDFRYVTKFLDKQGTAGLALALPTVAGLTPKGVDIEVVDENWQEVDFDVDCDVVGITAMTLQSKRAYEIADEFRARGKTVILGGMHPSTLPEEASQHADSVVCGEVEDIWAGVIQDLHEGHLQPIYRAPGFPDISRTVFARRELISNEHYMGDLVQSSRGCPFDCDFCSIQKFLGQNMRFKANDHFIKELRHIYEYSGRSPFQKVLVITDDNFYGNPVRTKSLLRDMVKLNREMPIAGWFCQCTMNVAQDDECLELLAEAGCKNIELGIESLSDQDLVEGIGKRINKVDAYSWTIERIRAHGMDSVCSFIFGGETDTTRVFENTVNFINENNIITAVLNIATPLPGTDYYAKMEREGRILHKDWSLFDTQHCVIQPKGMSPRELEEGYIWANKEIFSLPSLRKKL